MNLSSPFSVVVVVAAIAVDIFGGIGGVGGGVGVSFLSSPSGGVLNSSVADVSLSGSVTENLPVLGVVLLGVDDRGVGVSVGVGRFLPTLPDVLSDVLDAV